MDDSRRTARRLLTEMPEKAAYLALMDRVKLTHIERAVCDMKYLDGHNLGFIADSLGFAEVTIKKHHAQALKKIARIIGG